MFSKVLWFAALVLCAYAQEESHPAPEPYSFTYESPNEDGSSNARQEVGDANGRITGFYVIKGLDGQDRRVDYFADETGFHAEVSTNEAGTTSHEAAEALYKSSAPAVEDQIAYWESSGAGAAAAARRANLVSSSRSVGSSSASFTSSSGGSGATLVQAAPAAGLSGASLRSQNIRTQNIQTGAGRGLSGGGLSAGGLSGAALRIQNIQAEAAGGLSGGGLSSGLSGATLRTQNVRTQNIQTGAAGGLAAGGLSAGGLSAGLSGATLQTQNFRTQNIQNIPGSAIEIGQLPGQAISAGQISGGQISGGQGFEGYVLVPASTAQSAGISGQTVNFDSLQGLNVLPGGASTSVRTFETQPLTTTTTRVSGQRFVSSSGGLAGANTFVDSQPESSYRFVTLQRVNKK